MKKSHILDWNGEESAPACICALGVKDCPACGEVVQIIENRNQGQD